MRVVIVISILLAIGLIVLIYKRESDISKMLLSFGVLGSILGLALVGTVMRSLMPLFLTHLVALIFSYLGLIYYIFSNKKQWIVWLLPIATLLFYLLLAWIGNEHI
jgi:hypothetical protein